MESGRERLLAALAEEVRDERVLAAIAAVDRTAFVPRALRGHAWENRPLPIGSGQTISQPQVVAHMLALLDVRPGDHVLDVGTGSGWHAALLAELGGAVWSVERHAALAVQARDNLRAAGVSGVRVVAGDGALGLPAHAPYDAINVAAAAAGGVPPALRDQLAADGRLVAPVATGREQHLILVRGGATTWAGAVRFVPLVETRPD